MLSWLLGRCLMGCLGRGLGLGLGKGLGELLGKHPAKGMHQSPPHLPGPSRFVARGSRQHQSNPRFRGRECFDAELATPGLMENSIHKALSATIHGSKHLKDSWVLSAIGMPE